jgi:hypothetical protein
MATGSSSAIWPPAGDLLLSHRIDDFESAGVEIGDLIGLEQAPVRDEAGSAVGLDPFPSESGLSRLL